MITESMVDFTQIVQNTSIKFSYKNNRKSNKVFAYSLNMKTSTTVTIRLCCKVNNKINYYLNSFSVRSF